MIRKTVVPAVILFIFLSAFSATLDGAPITQITFPELKRTRYKTVLEIISPVAPGSEYSPETEELIVQKLRKSGIFNPDIEVESIDTNEGIELVVNASEKWTLLPFPVITYSDSGDWDAGAVFFERNLFGLNKSLGLGIVFSPEEWTGMGFYIDPKINNSNYSLITAVMAGQENNEYQDTYEDTYLKFLAEDVRASLIATRSFKSPLSLSSGIRFGHFHLLSLDKGELAVSDSQELGILAGFLWRDFYYDVPFTRGISLELNGEWNMGLGESEDYMELTGRFSGSFSPWANHLAALSARAGWGTQPVHRQFSLGGVPCSLTLPSGKIRAEAYAAASVEYSIPLVVFSLGAVSLKGYYEGGVYKSDFTDFTTYHGPGVALEFLIKDVAVPAVNFNIAWNLETGEYQLVAGAGM